jgi:hypothetical protein
MTLLRRRLAALALAAPLMLTGCGDDPDPAPESSPSEDTSTSPPASSPTPTPTPTEASDESCAMLDTEAVTAVLGEGMVLSASGPQTCIFGPTDPASAASLTVSLTELAIDPTEYAAGTRDLCEGEVTEVEAGDVAFACVTFVGPQGYVFVDSVSILLDVVTADESEPVALAAAAALLPSVTAP